jgi:hypothetical protein
MVALAHCGTLRKIVRQAARLRLSEINPYLLHDGIGPHCGRMQR